MPCYHTIEITNPKKVLSLESNEQFLLNVPCGWCQGCLDAKNNEYALRTYYEMLECMSDNSFVLFDCLTYRERDVPKLKYYLNNLELGSHANDYCFDQDDMRYFFVRLRRRLDYLGYKSNKTAFRYFYSTEFGKKNTKRPHIHIMFFVHNGIDPIQLSNLISDCWQLGRTDGAKYRGAKYVLNHCTFKKDNSLEHVYNCVNYVTKYITKDLESKPKTHKYILEILNPITKKTKYKEYTSDERKLYRYIWNLKANYHRQSQGFGSYMLECIPEDYIRKECNVYYSHKGKSILQSIPLYYIRKLYYFRNQYMNVQNKDKVYETFELTSIGKEFYKNKIKKNIQNTYKNFLSFSKTENIDLNAKTLTYYKTFDYGRIKEKSKQSTLNDLIPIGLTKTLESKHIYNYLDRKSYENLGYNCLSNTYIDIDGNISEIQPITKKDFISNSVNSILPDSISSTCHNQMLRYSKWLAEKGIRKRAENNRKKYLKDKFKILNYVDDYQ